MTALSLRLVDLESNAFFFYCLLSSIVLHVSGEIHSDLQVFEYTIVSLAASIIAVLRSSIGQGHLILEDDEAVPECDVELLPDEFVLQL